MTQTDPSIYEGGCTCGNVRFRMMSSPMFVHCCHCRWCQRETGASYALNAMIESERVELLSGEVKYITIPSNSGKGQKVARCPHCQVAVWSHYGVAGDAISFIRVGSLDQPGSLPPDIHIFTSSKQPWVQLSADIPSVDEYYRASDYWPEPSMERRHDLVKKTSE